jgi:23S rRNA pseudouridine1911/1915/1917 synthase
MPNINPEKINLDITYEDDNVVVINKKAGMLVHPNPYTQSGTLSDTLLKLYPQIADVGEKNRPGIVHRLDKETSGLIICAKNQKTYEYLCDQFQKRKVIKKYQALVYGKVKEKKGVIVYSIAKRGREKLEQAETRYRVLKYFTNFSLLEVEIKTGRMHQIRQHLKKIGHPIVGDNLYSFKNLKPPFPISRYFLHAFYLKLILPSGKVGGFKIDLPEELKIYLDKLESK